MNFEVFRSFSLELLSSFDGVQCCLCKESAESV